MPTYEYKCEKCNHVFDEIQPLTAVSSELKCPECGKVAKRTITPLKFKLKGKGWPGKEMKKDRYY